MSIALYEGTRARTCGMRSVPRAPIPAGASLAEAIAEVDGEMECLI